MKLKNLKTRYFILPIATLSLLSGLWMIEHNHHNHFTGRSIASEAKAEDKKDEVAKDDKEDKIKSLEDLVACQKKVIADLKDDMAKKIDDLKKIVADYDKKQEKKKDDKKEDKKEPRIAEDQPNDQQTLAVLMHLTSLIQSRQLQAQPQMGMSYMPVYEQMIPQLSFYRDYYENSMFYDQIGMGRSYLQQSYPRMGSMGGFNNYQNPYQQPSMFQDSMSSQHQQLMGHIPNSLQRMPMLGDEFNFSQNQGLMRQPSSGFQF